MPDALLIAAIALLGAFTQGFLGFGFGIVTMSGLTLSHDLIHASGVVNLTGIALTSGYALRLRRQVLWPVLGRIVPGIVVGVAFGVQALRRFEAELMIRVLGATIVGVAAWNLARPALRPREAPLLDGAMGLLAGLLGGAFNTGGPPLIAHLYRRPETPGTLIATVQVAFLSIGLTRLPVAWSQGLMGPAVWQDALLALPAVFLGVWGGSRLAQRVSPEQFRRACWVGLGAVGLALLALR